MLNRCEFIGRLGKDPVIRNTQQGKKIARFSIAVSEKYKDKNGERQEKTEWINAVVFNDGLSGVVERYLRKGSLVFIAGKFRNTKWTGDDGVERYGAEVHLDAFNGELTMLDSKPDSTKTATENYSQPAVDPADELEDQIPFSPAWVLER